MSTNKGADVERVTPSPKELAMAESQAQTVVQRVRNASAITYEPN
jgi:hypothetical protein